jgi:hypothetical protein
MRQFSSPSNDIAVLVYQAGTANVFLVNNSSSPKVELVRMIQGGFYACEQYARGVRACGFQVMAAWCNKAGDVAANYHDWSFTNFDDAPFSDQFAPDIISPVCRTPDGVKLRECPTWE